MSDVVIQVDSLWKKYRLGVLGTGTLRHDFNCWLHRVLGKPDPYAKVGEIQKAESRKQKLTEGGQNAGEDQKAETRKQKSETPGDKTDNRSEFQLSAFPISAFPKPALSSDEMWALRDVSFEVKQGEILGIIGRNGAGKSTLLKILSRVTAPTSGEVRVKGRIASLLEVGTGFHPELTGRENIFLNGAILGMTKTEIKSKLDEIVAFAEIEKFLDTPVKRYSSGMYVRLAFAVAAHLEPEILIVDEVLAVGDAEFQKKCLGKMQSVATNEGRTVLFVSHNMGAINELCSRCVLLNRGAIEKEGGTKEVVETYLTPGATPTSVPLSARTDRTGSGRLRFTRVRLLVEGREVSAVKSGQKLTVELSYEAPESIESASLRFGISLLTLAGVEFVSFDSASTTMDICTLPRRGALMCEVPSLPVVRGAYRGWIYAGINGNVADRVEDAFELEVIGGQFPRQGFFALAHEWNVAPDPRHSEVALAANPSPAGGA
jgi:lipopolysaccharide transport system ATP-binding protein